MANTVQAAACTLLLRYAGRTPLRTTTFEWVQAILHDPAFVEDEPEGVELTEGEEAFLATRQRQADEIRALARAVVLDRRMGSPAEDYTTGTGLLTRTTSLAAAIAEFCVRMEGIVYDAVASH